MLKLRGRAGCGCLETSPKKLRWLLIQQKPSLGWGLGLVSAASGGFVGAAIKTEGKWFGLDIPVWQNEQVVQPILQGVLNEMNDINLYEPFRCCCDICVWLFFRTARGVELSGHEAGRGGVVCLGL